MAYVRIAELGELSPTEGTVVRVGPCRVALFRVEDEVLALDSVCPHAGGPLWLGEREGELVTCPFHGWRFDLRSGACVSVPGEAVAVWPTRVEGGSVYVDLGREAGG